MNQNKNSSSLILVHHGILGQKWGVRRYQKADGSLTLLGRMRYRRESQEELRKAYKNAQHANAIVQLSRITQKGAVNLSNVIDKIQPKKKVPIYKHIAGNLKDKQDKHLEEKGLSDLIARNNADARTSQFLEKRDAYIEQFGTRKIKDLLKESKYKMSNAKAFAVAYLTPFQSQKYDFMENVTGHMVKNDIKISDIIFSKK